MGLVMLVIQIILSVILPVWLYLWFSKQIKKQFSSYTGLGYNVPDMQFLLKRWWAEWSITAKEQSERVELRDYEKNFRTVEYTKPRCPSSPRIKGEHSSSSVFFYGTDQSGNSVFVKFARRRRRTAEISLQLTTAEGQVYVLPDCPETTVIINSTLEWSAAGLRIELLEAQQRWRISYNGMLRNACLGSTPNDENVEHVRLNVIFVANSRPLKWPGDWSSKLHSDALAREPWRSPEWIKKIKLLDYTGTDQWGSMIGQLTFKDSTVKTLYLRGIYQQRSGKHESNQFHNSVTIFGIMGHGPMYYLGASSTKYSFSRIQFGHARESFGATRPIDWTDLELSDYTEQKCGTNAERKIRFIVGDGEHQALVKLRNSTVFHSGQPWNWTSQVFNLELELNGKKGVGIMQLWYPHEKSSQVQTPPVKIQYSITRPNSFIQRDDHVLFFSDEGSLVETTVGGKCLSLAMLTSIKDTDFVVPEGFCVTVGAFEAQMQSSKELQEMIDDLESISTGRKTGDLKKRCEEVERFIETTPIIEPVKIAILKAIEKCETLNEKNEKHSYAVRSSAVGEDSEETSAAGQNSTYLGVKGSDNIVKGVAKCWASLFSYKSIEYRRQHGLCIKATMGVCVQKMVNAEVAGVMFTRHPTTGDPSNIIITSNYGLGETVVSAMVEPDTITVRRSWNDKLSIKSSVLGNKKEKISMSSEGVTTEILDKQESDQISLSEKIALRLAAIGIQLETLFGIGRDVEWAVVGNTIYLLQARPITTLHAWTEFELTHELDMEVPSDVDVLTFANIGEVLPYPVSPLSLSTSCRILNGAIASKYNEFDTVYVHVTAMRCSMNYLNSFLRMVDSEITMLNKVTDLAISGKIVITPEMHEVARERGIKVNAIIRMCLFWDMLKDIWYLNFFESKARELIQELHIQEHTSPRELYNEINKKFEYIYEIGLCHMTTSTVCITYQLILITSIVKADMELEADVFSDITALLSSRSNVLGTEIPIALRKIVKFIKSSGKVEEFEKLNPREVLGWLETNCPTAAKELKQLIKEHGHRCIQELDLFSESWSLNPESLISTIQVLIKSPEENAQKKELSIEETVESLKTPTSAINRWWLKKMLPLYRKSVCSRESTKSALVSAAHKFKVAYRKLGKQMVSEGYIPSENLIFFLTHREIGQILDKRNPVLVQKAQRRYKLYPRLKELQYPEVNVGVPMPIKVETNVENLDGCTKVRGIPACGGSILGRACVIKNISEATSIQQGDILITHSTDIAWSPYFPLLGGIVTELGGLISHGAVVAREYGIPSIIAAATATQVFQTGDTVLLAADVGTLQLIKRC